MHGTRPHWAISTWQPVQPRVWFPVSSLEQSMMELDDFVAALTPIPRSSDVELFKDMNDKEFFKDLPGFEEKLHMEMEQEAEEEEAVEEPKALANAYSTYSYTSSFTTDKDGKRVESIRRRYQDASGRVKALTERRIGDQVLTEVWNKNGEEEKGTYKQKCLTSSKDDFEKMWKETPFGKTQAKKALKEEETKMAEEEEKP